MTYEEDLEKRIEQLEYDLQRSYKEIEYLEQELSHYRKCAQGVKDFSDWATNGKDFPLVERSFKQFQASQK